MTVIDTNYERYEMLRFVVRHGKRLAILVALGVMALGLHMAFEQRSILTGVLSVVAALLAYGLLRTLTELVMAISDLLLPK